MLVADGRDPLAAVALADVRTVEVDLETVGGRAEAVVVDKLSLSRQREKQGNMVVSTVIRWMTKCSKDENYGPCGVRKAHTVMSVSSPSPSPRLLDQRHLVVSSRSPPPEP